MVPSESLALALMVMLAGAVNTALFAGLVMFTVGAAFAGSSVAISLSSAWMYSFANLGVGDACGGGTGATVVVKAGRAGLKERHWATLPPITTRQRSAEKITRGRCFLGVADFLIARLFNVDIAPHFQHGPPECVCNSHLQSRLNEVCGHTSSIHLNTKSEVRTQGNVRRLSADVLRSVLARSQVPKKTAQL